MLGGSQLDVDALLVQVYRIVARLHAFVLVHEGWVLTLLELASRILTRLITVIAAMSDIWQQRHIAQLADTGTTEVHVAKAYECGVAGVIARAPVPSLRHLSGTDLYHSEWHIGTEEHMTVTTCSDGLIYPFCWVLAPVLMRYCGRRLILCLNSCKCCDACY